ncbi:hypothetical protein HLB44_18190 [Aquincola sp. S2]|uniref:Alkaline proteinase inhibitor/ Outer membrane lipoprotein Omp19 domain-containing protein n=1 Tax=Pseudaquabacterium terrae TaxID=2732868 RepID=A0ABX2EJU9_9BURK|nr:hypothetical protein [Aquabacterium terrae]NRF68927.1 hypothetical protein [Aquabacterium terrae]
MVRILVAAGIALMGGAAVGQSLSSLDGVWLARFPGPQGLPREAKLTLSGGTGSYQLLAKNRDDPCLGVQAPVVVSNLTVEGFDLQIQMSKALNGCRDAFWKPRRVDDRNYEGVFPDGRRFVITRQ